MRWLRLLGRSWSGLMGVLGLAVGFYLVPGMVLNDWILVAILGVLLYLWVPCKRVGLCLALSLFGLWVMGLGVAVWAVFVSFFLCFLLPYPGRCRSLRCLDDAGRMVLGLVVGYISLSLTSPGSPGALGLSAFVYMATLAFIDPHITMPPRTLLPKLVFQACLAGLAYLAWDLAGQMAAVSVFILAVFLGILLERGQKRRIARAFGLLLEGEAPTGQSRRVVQYATAIAWQMGLDFVDSETLRYAGLLHDTGYSSGIMEIRDKPSRLTLEETRMLEMHPVNGARVVHAIGGNKAMSEAVLYHHERYDGQGYPRGLKGKEIPLGARILAVADAFDALTSRRPYRNGVMDTRTALAELRKGCGKQFDPECVEALARFLEAGSLEAPGESEAALKRLRHLLAEASLTSFSSGGPLKAYQDIRQDASMVLALWDFSRQVCAESEVDSICRLIHTAVGCGLPDSRALVFLDEGQGFAVYDSGGACGISVGCEGPVRKVFQEGLPVITKDLGRDWPDAPAFLKDARSGVFMPLRLRNKAQGVMGVFLNSRHLFTPFQLSFLGALAKVVSLAVGNALLQADMQERLKEQVETRGFIDAMLEAVSSGILVIDPQYSVRIINRRAMEILEDLNFTPLETEKGYQLDPKALPIGLVARAMEEGKEVSVYRQSWQGAGGKVILSGSGAPLYDEAGTLMGAVAVFEDVTEKVLLEKEMRDSQKMAALGELASSAAHEIRNPLTALKGFLQLLQHSIDETSRSRYIHIMCDEMDRMNRIVEDLLLMSRPQGGLDQDLHLNDILIEIYETWEQKAEDQAVDVYLSLEECLPLVKGHRNQIKQVLHNLVANALDAIQNHGRLTLSTRARPDCVEVSVADTGNGIPPSHMGKIFNPFFTTKEKGTGLGLAVCFGIVKAHLGRMDIETSLGCGTTVTLYLPVPKSCDSDGTTCTSTGHTQSIVG